jgi:hypothetical protein
VAPDGWTVTAGADGFLIVNPGSGGEQTRLDFGNFENFTVSGRKALDINGDGGSASETFLGGFTVFVDDDGDGVFDAGERSAVSADLTGLWSIGGLTPDDVGKRVYEATPDGWTTTFGMDGYVIVNPGSGGEQTNLDFNNFENFTISGRKVQDDDGDGNIAEDATFLGGFTIFVDDDGDGVLDAGERSTVSADGTGLWSITNLAPEDAGKRVYEVTPSGWTQTVGTGGFVIANPGSGGEQTGLDFGNFEDFTISGRKVLDADGDGNLAEEATFLGGFTIFVDDDGDGVLDAGERSTLTAIDTTGSWSISGLTPDDVGKRVYEVVPSDWTQTVGIGGLVIVNPGSGGEQTGMDFGNTDRNDAPVIRGGDSAIYFVRVNSAGITTIVATDADSSVITYSIVGGTDAGRFMINASTGELAFDKHAAPANRSYVLQVQAADGAGGADQQDITINVVADKMKGDAAQAVAETFVFHPKFGANSISNFDVGQDFLQFDSGMFAADTAAAVLATARDNKKGDVIIDIQAGHLEILGVTKAELQAHPEQFLFV